LKIHPESPAVTSTSGKAIAADHPEKILPPPPSVPNSISIHHVQIAGLSRSPVSLVFGVDSSLTQQAIAMVSSSNPSWVAHPGPSPSTSNTTTSSLEESAVSNSAFPLVPGYEMAKLFQGNLHHHHVPFFTFMFPQLFWNSHAIQSVDPAACSSGKN
jgi:hypothetical protein